MKVSTMRTKIASLLLLLPLLVISVAPLNAKDEKMKPEELVAKHLASIGAPEALAAVRNRAVIGSAQAIFRLPSPGQISGKGNLISEGRQTRISMSFPSVDYPGEQMVFDGNKVFVDQLRPGQRSNLSAFVYTYDMLLKEGLLGGTMTTAWALLDVPARQPKLNYTGLKKVDGKQVHELKYRAKKGAGDIQVSLYFEPETFRHVSSQFRLTQPASMGRTPNESAAQKDTVYTLVETYGDFKTVDSLTLPHTYKLVFTIEGQSATVFAEYSIAAAEVLQNQTLDTKTFVVQ